MAYPANVGPNGFTSVNLIGGRVFNGAIRQFPIASAYASNIAAGDLVAINSSGQIVRVDTTTGAKAAFAIAPIGVFTGCRYTDPSLQYALYAQSWPAGTVASDAYGYVIEDPDVVFIATLTDSSGNALTSSAATQAAVGQNIGYYQAGGTGGTALINTNTRDSVVSLNLSSLNTTATLPFRVIDVVKETALTDGTYVQLQVTYNFGLHFYRQALGI
jgi:hypothetical protein